MGCRSLGHVLAPVDILRRQGGHDVLLPVCTERLEDFLRAAPAAPSWQSGEAVTLAVSLLRGIGELSATAAAARGVWWLTEAGDRSRRPTPAPHRLDEQTAAHLRSVAAEAPSLARHLEEAAQALTDPADAPASSRAPKRRSSRSPIRSRWPRPRSAPARPSSHLRRRPVDTTEPDPVPTVVGALPVTPSRCGMGGSSLADHDRALACSARATHRTQTSLAVAGGLAGVVLIGGLLWPTDGGGPATAGVPADPPATSTPSPGIRFARARRRSTRRGRHRTRPGRDRRRPAQRTDRLRLRSSLSRAGHRGRRCSVPRRRRRSGCRGSHRDTARRIRRSGRPACGGVASPASPQLVVIVRTGDRWLLRDVYDVPEQ